MRLVSLCPRANDIDVTQDGQAVGSPPTYRALPSDELEAPFAVRVKLPRQYNDVRRLRLHPLRLLALVREQIEAHNGVDVSLPLPASVVARDELETR